MVYSWLTVGLHLVPACVSRLFELTLPVKLAECLRLQLVANCISAELNASQL